MTVRARVTWICVIAETHVTETSGIRILVALESAWCQAPETLLNQSGLAPFHPQVSFDHLRLLLSLIFESIIHTPFYASLCVSSIKALKDAC